MDEKQKILAVETAIREHADWAATDSATILWSMVDNISFSEDNKIVRARWKAKLLFNTTEETGIAGTSIPENIIYEEQIVELNIIEQDELTPVYFVTDWDIEPDVSVFMGLAWDDEEITQDDIDIFCRWQDKESLRDELIDLFGSKEEVNLDLFPTRLCPLLKECLNC